MNLETILDRFEAGEALPRGRVAGLGEAYFNRILALYGSENEQLARLGSRWKVILRHSQDAAWVYRAGGIYLRSRGMWAASAEAFLEAGNSALDPISQSSFQIGAIDSLARSGKLAESEALANRLSKSLKQQGQDALAARALLNLGNAFVYQDRMVEARRALLLALPSLDASDFKLEAASARLALSSTHLYGGDPRKAEEYANQVIAYAEEGSYLANLAKLNLALSLIVTNRPEQAHKMLMGLGPEFTDSPVDSLRVSEYLGDALFRLNLWGEAEESYREALRSKTPLVPLHRANVELGIGQTLLAQEQVQDARLQFLHALKGYEDINNRPWQAVCLHNLALCDVMRGHKSAARKKLLDAEIRASESPFHLARILLAQSELGTNRSRSAHALIQRYGYLDLEWQVHYLRAKDSHSPGPSYRRMFNAILAGRLATSSLAARMGFLKDKSQALRDYLGWLLSRPTTARVNEATMAIQQVRSVTLIDEIIHQGSVPDSVRAIFEEVRAELESTFDETPNGGTRLSGANIGSLVRAQKSATQALLGLNLNTFNHAAQSSDCVILAETTTGLQILQNDRATRPCLPDSNILEALRWLTFELLAPITDENASAKPVNQVLDVLTQAFEPVWEMDASRICPDGYSWRIPWSLCADRAGQAKNWTLAMHPRMDAKYTQIVSAKSKAAVWLGQSNDLPFAKKEAEAIAAMFDHCEILTTRVQAKKSLYDSYDILHVVSHAIHRPQNPMLSSLQFPDGPLFAYDIARSPLRVGLATLSACETGSMSIATRSEPDGLARAFIARGCETVVASQWLLNDEAAFIQFQALYLGLLQKKSVDLAISDVQCICRDWRAHPYFWAALALYSGYRG
ncbi:MAG: CHAT domain-containing protein [Armatimonadetes bacterium]|nr:CHAT domain-containing protein [Armatimonadota bacterium]